MALVNYVTIENNQVLKRHSFDDSDTLKIQKLVAHDYKIEDDAGYDSNHYTIGSDEWVIVGDTWQHQYTLVPKYDIETLRVQARTDADAVVTSLANTHERKEALFERRGKTQNRKNASAYLDDDLPNAWNNIIKPAFENTGITYDQLVALTGNWQSYLPSEPTETYEAEPKTFASRKRQISKTLIDTGDLAYLCGRLVDLPGVELDSLDREIVKKIKKIRANMKKTGLDSSRKNEIK